MTALLTSRTCCGCVPIRTGAIIITIFGILNKLSGFYGLISFEYSDPAALTVYIYSLAAALIFARGLWGIHTDKVRIVRWYTIFYWFDCLVSTVTTVLFAIKWYVYTDHSLPELATDLTKQLEHDKDFRMESIVSIIFLVVLRLVHVYFALILTSYYRSVGKAQYSKLAAAVDEDLEDAHYDSSVRRHL